MTSGISGPEQHETFGLLRSMAAEQATNALQACLETAAPNEQSTVDFSTLYKNLRRVFNFQPGEDTLVNFPDNPTPIPVDFVHQELTRQPVGSYGGCDIFEDVVVFAWSEPEDGDITLVRWSLIHIDNEALFRGGKMEFLKVQSGEEDSGGDFDITFHTRKISDCFYEDDLTEGKFGPYITWDTAREIPTIHNGDPVIDVVSDCWGTRRKDEFGQEELEATMDLMNKAVELLMPEQAIDASRIFMDRRMLTFMRKHAS